MCRQFRIKGLVQGVFFRANTAQVANRLQIAGHAINKADGTVEVLACGDDSCIEELVSWLKQGPPRASVSDVIESGVECRSPARFVTG